LVQLLRFMLKEALGVLLFAVIGTGCQTSAIHRPVSFVPIGRTFAPHPRPVEYVEVYTARPPPVPFVEAGVLVEEGGDANLRWAAAQVGCNAIFMLAPVTDVSSSPSLFSRGQSVSSRTTYRATCLVYTERRLETSMTPEPGSP
jgi:hypothetical protein